MTYYFWRRNMMKFLKESLVIAITMLALIIVASAQSQRSADDPRNIAPTVGGGGPVGGATGLFTVYDGQTLRRGEYTFSTAYSNYDRDPGDVDITEVPLSFQYGLTNNLEVFFSTDAYRGIKVNSPRNLSGFYLPNSGGSLPSIILSRNRAVFRPQGNQPFVQFPYVGGSGGSAGILGPVTIGGVANNFPGIGSVYGGILPGIVLQTTNIGNIPVPTNFTLAPSYLPDAPLLNRSYSETAFNTFTFGGKWRINSNDSPVGFGIIPFYRFYADNADSFEGFNQLQRGASPGGSNGDFGLIGFADARLRKWLNVSSNIGYIYNGNIKGSIDGTEVTLLDRPDELISGIGVDFPVNENFQPIAEFRSVQYIGGRTPNAFENNQLDALVGVRVFPKRWFGFSAAYRYHANSQNAESPGFRASLDPHGFIFQGFIGRRNEREIAITNTPANVTDISLSRRTISLGCKPGFKSTSGSCQDDKIVDVTTSALDAEGDPLTYNYTVTGGRIIGQGSNVSWDLSGLEAGSYVITAGVDDGLGLLGEAKSVAVIVEECGDCVEECECPTSISVSDAPVAAAPGENLTFTATITGGSQESPTYSWSVDKGSIVSGQGTSTITVSTEDLDDTTVTATVTVGGLCNTCTNNSDSGTGIVSAKPTPVGRDEFGNISNNDVKARLDPYSADLQADPNSVGYIINYGSSEDVIEREKLIRNYLIINRGIDASRLVFIVGDEAEPVIRTRLWIVPAGADPSTVD